MKIQNIHFMLISYHGYRYKFYTSTLLNWYQKNRRDLPWRFSSNPYEIWIAEVIFNKLALTKGINYYHRFIERFPNISMLANASEDEVLKL